MAQIFLHTGIMRTLIALALAACCSLAAAESVRTVANAQEFDQLIASSPQTVVVDFTATWCGPCKMLAPVLEELATAHADRLVVVKVDVDQHPDLAKRFAISSIPALHRFQGGKAVDSRVGFQPKERLVEWLGLAAAAK